MKKNSGLKLRVNRDVDNPEILIKNKNGKSLSFQIRKISKDKILVDCVVFNKNYYCSKICENILFSKINPFKLEKYSNMKGELKLVKTNKAFSLFPESANIEMELEDDELICELN